MYLLLVFATHLCVTWAMNVTFENTISTRCRFSSPCFPSQEDMSQLHDNMTGYLILPHMDDYKKYVLAYNTYEQRYPGLIAMVKSVNDIKEAILWARKYNLHVTIRSSGHCYLGRSTWDGSFNINLALMKEMEVKLNSTRSTHGEVKVQTGLTWIEIYEKVNQYGRVVVGGSAHTVTPGGYTLGGGHSPISRSLGYAVDNVLEFQIVLADGNIATCIEAKCDILHLDGTTSTDTSGDLFWAVRGGGGGTFGVIVYFVYKLHPDVSQMVHATGNFPFKLELPASNAKHDLTERTLDAMNALIKTLPREWGGYWLLDNTYIDYQNPNSTTRIIVHGKFLLSLNKFAPWDGTEEEVFSDFIALKNEFQLDFKFSNRSGFLDYEKRSYDPPTVRTTFFAVLLQNSSFNDNLKDYVKREFYDTYPRPEVIGCTFIMLGGKTSEFPMESTPLNKGYRTAIASMTCWIALGTVDQNDYFHAPENDSYFSKKADKSALELRKLGHGMYFNEASKNNPYWQTDYWNDYLRLLEIKKKYDPKNFFTCHQCVGSEEIKPTATSGVSTLAPATAIIIFMCLYTLKLFVF